MSYILDALKKAEKERQRSAADELLRSGDAFAAAEHNRIIWPYVLIAALLLNAAIFGWLLGPWNAKGRKDAATLNRVPSGFTTQAPPASSAASPQRAETRSDIGRPAVPDTPGNSLNVSSVATAGPTPRHISKESEPSEETPSRKTEPLAGNETVAAPADAVHASKDEQSVLPHRDKVFENAPGGGNKIYKRSELPQSVLNALPDLSLSLHLYNADPSARLINVKGKTLREGEELSAGLKLEEIRPEGAVFSFRNYRFEVGINSR